MDSLASVSPSIVFPIRSHQYHRLRRLPSLPCTSDQFLGRIFISSRFCVRKLNLEVCCNSRGGGRENETNGESDRREEEFERAMRMDGTIPGSSDAFVKQVSSRAYDMRRNLQQTFDSSSYDVLDANPWRETSKSVYVLTHQENQLCTMKTRRNRSEVERELGLLFSKTDKWRNQSSQSNQSGTHTKFHMLVEDVREGVLVFEDQNEAAKYCDLLQGGGQNCEGVTEIEASFVFDLCKKNKALAVLFRRGRTPPVPENLKLNLGARKRSLEDQEDSV